MRQIGLGAYQKRVSRAAQTLLDHQGFDGGWGLTLTSVSSIVNTTEALAILHAAGIGGSQFAMRCRFSPVLPRITVGRAALASSFRAGRTPVSCWIASSR